MISMLLMYYKYDFYILNIFRIYEFRIANLNKKLYYKLFFSCFIIVYYNLLICIIKKSFYSSLIIDFDILSV